MSQPTSRATSRLDSAMDDMAMPLQHPRHQAPSCQHHFDALPPLPVKPGKGVEPAGPGQPHGAHAPPPPPLAPAPDHGHAQRTCLLPKEIYEHIAEGGEAKPRNSLLREVVLGLLAGAFIGFGFSTCMLAAGQLSHEYRKAEPGMFNLLFGAYGFPVGLSMCIINGASLFTSNIAYMMAAFMERRASAPRALWIVLLSYFTNLAGSLFLVQLMISADVFAHREAFTIELALKKTSASFGACLTKGILCNWLVCMAVWQANAAQDITGKLLGIWFPISAFVTMGFEHCIANMFVIPLAMRLGAPITTGAFITKNLIPATLGNLIGGGFFVATAFGLAFGSWERAVCGAAARLWHAAAPQPLRRVADLAGGGAGGSSAASSNSSSTADLAVLPVAALPNTRGAKL